MSLTQFSEKQLQILDFILSGDYALICDGAVRSGKTTVMAMAFLLWAMEFFDQTSFAICGKTVRSAERNVLYPLLQHRSLPYELSYKSSKGLLTVRCGQRENRFYLFGGRDESSYMLIQGITLAGVMFDEVALMPKSFVDQAMSRCISYPNAKYFFNCNPASPEHSFYQEWIRSPRPNTRHLHFRLQDNPILTPEQISRTGELYSGVFYRRYILGEWCGAEGLVYDFSEKAIVDTLPSDGEYYISVDYGTLNPFSAGLWCLSEGRAVRISEYYHSGRDTHTQKTDEQYCDALQRLADGYSIRKVIVDPSAASFITALRRRGFHVIRAKNDVLDGIRTTAALLQSGRLLIHRSCVHAIAEFGLYRWDEASAKDRVIKENDHAMDEIRYFAATVMKQKSNGEYNSLWALGGAKA